MLLLLVAWLHLPRVVILTMHDMSLKPKTNKNNVSTRGLLELSGTVKTYRYLDDQEIVNKENRTADAASKKDAP